jgi:mRNA interferase RelE/StbE
MLYEVQLKPNAQKFLRKLDSKTFNRILLSINNLKDNPYPYGYKKLVGLENTYRIRIGDFRIIYSVESQRLIIMIITIAHRKDVYKR